MRIGALNKRISFESETRISDGMGGYTTSFAIVASSIPAAIWPVSAKEIVKMNMVSMVIDYRIRVRYRKVLKPSWRVKFAGRYFSIVSIVDVDMKHKHLDILCKEAA